MPTYILPTCASSDSCSTSNPLPSIGRYLPIFEAKLPLGSASRQPAPSPPSKWKSAIKIRSANAEPINTRTRPNQSFILLLFRLGTLSTFGFRMTGTHTYTCKAKVVLLFKQYPISNFHLHSLHVILLKPASHRICLISSSSPIPRPSSSASSRHEIFQES